MCADKEEPPKLQSQRPDSFVRFPIGGQTRTRRPPLNSPVPIKCPRQGDVLSAGRAFAAVPIWANHSERVDHFLRADAAFLIRVAALFVSDSFSKPNTAEYFPPTTWATTKVIFIPASPIVLAIAWPIAGALSSSTAKVWQSRTIAFFVDVKTSRWSNLHSRPVAKTRFARRLLASGIPLSAIASMVRPAILRGDWRCIRVTLVFVIRCHVSRWSFAVPCRAGLWS
jgi:hypothetical protein